jgi:DUF438 domain-containing protein
MLEEMKIFKEICDAVDIQMGYSDENGISKFFNRAMYASGKRKESDLDKHIKDCHTEKTHPKIDFIYKAFEEGRRKPFAVKRVIGGKKTVVNYYPVFIEGVFRGVFETIIHPEKLLEDFPFPGEFGLFKTGQGS